MKSARLLILLIFTMGYWFMANAQTENISDKEYYDVKGNTRCVTRTNYLNPTIVNGKVTKYKSAEKVFYQYNANDNLDCITFFDFNNKVKSKITFEYDEQGRIAFAKNSLSTFSKTFDYISDRQKDVKSESYLDGSIKSNCTSYYYNSKKQLSRSVHVDSYGKRNITVYEYDDNGRLLSYRFPSFSGSGMYIVNYEYDASGKLIKCVEKFENANELIQTNTLISYNEHGHISKVVNGKWADPEGGCYIHFADRGNPVYLSHDTFTYKYTYDSHGNWIVCIKYDKDGKVSSYSKRDILYLE